MTDLYKFKKTFKNAIEDERDLFYDFLTSEVSTIKKMFDYQVGNYELLNSLKQKILKDDDFINHIYRVLDANYGIDFSENFKIDVALLKDEDDYKGNIFVTLEVKLCYKDDIFTEKFNYYWMLIK